MHGPACDCCCRLLGKKWSRAWWNWPRLAPESSSSKTSCKPVRRTLSSRCPVLEMSSRMIPWHCKFIPIQSLPFHFVFVFCSTATWELGFCEGGKKRSNKQPLLLLFLSERYNFFCCQLSFKLCICILFENSYVSSF